MKKITKIVIASLTLGAVGIIPSVAVALFKNSQIIITSANNEAIDKTIKLYHQVLNNEFIKFLIFGTKLLSDEEIAQRGIYEFHTKEFSQKMLNDHDFKLIDDKITKKDVQVKYFVVTNTNDRKNPYLKVVIRHKTVEKSLFYRAGGALKTYLTRTDWDD